MRLTITDCLVKCQIAESKGDALRLLKQKAIKVDNQLVDRNFVFDTGSAKDIEAISWGDWYVKYFNGEYVDDHAFMTLGKLLDKIGVKAFKREIFQGSPSAVIAGMILSDTFLISSGRADYWVMRLNDVDFPSQSEET